MKQTKSKILRGVSCLLAASILCSTASLALTNTQQLFSVVEADYGVSKDDENVKNSYVLQLQQPAGVTYSYKGWSLSMYAQAGTSLLTETGITSVSSYKEEGSTDTWYTLLYSASQANVTFTYEFDSTVSGVTFDSTNAQVFNATDSSKKFILVISDWNTGADKAIQMTASVTKSPEVEKEISLNGETSDKATVSYGSAKLNEAFSFDVVSNDGYTIKDVTATVGGTRVALSSNVDEKKTSGTYTISNYNVTGDIKISVTLAENAYTITHVASAGQYIFTDTKGNDIGNSSSVAYDKDFSFKLEAKNGYSVEKAEVYYQTTAVNKKLEANEDGSYTLTAEQVAKEGTISVLADSISYKTITPTVTVKIGKEELKDFSSDVSVTYQQTPKYNGLLDFTVNLMYPYYYEIESVKVITWNDGEDKSESTLVSYGSDTNSDGVTTAKSYKKEELKANVKIEITLKARKYSITHAEVAGEYSFQEATVNEDGTEVTSITDLSNTSSVSYGNSFAFVLKTADGYSAEKATVSYTTKEHTYTLDGKEIGNYVVYTIDKDVISEGDGTISVKNVLKTQSITIQADKNVKIVSLKDNESEEALTANVGETLTEYTALNGRSYTLTFSVPTGYSLSMANNSLPLTPTQNTDGTYSVKLASVTSEQDISIALDEMIFVFNFAGYGTDELKSVTVNGSEIGEDGYIFTALESETYYTFKGWTCALLGLDSVNSISWTKLNDMSVAEYTFTSVWTFNSEKVQEMYKTAFTVSREKNSDDNKEKIIAQVKYDKTLMAELEKEMAAHGDSILATGYINYKVDDLDKIDEIARLPWVSLATEELSEAQEQKLLYQFSFKNSPNKAQLKMWSYMSGLSMDRWTITGMEETDKRSIYAYIVLKVDGEVVYVLSDLIEAKIETETASDASDGENDGVQNGTSGVVEESSGSSDSTGSTGSTGSTESENNGEE